MSADTRAMTALYLAGFTLAETAHRYGVTRQAVSKRVRHHAGAAAPALAAAHARAREARLRRDPPALPPGPPCAACRRPLRADAPPGARTHGGPCAERWEAERRRLDPDERERHRQVEARSVIRNASDRSPAKVRWALRVLCGQGPRR